MTHRIPSARASIGLMAIALTAAALLSACQASNPIQTAVTYNAADGVPVSLEDVQIRDLVVVTEKKGGPGTLSGSVINSASSSQTVTFSDGTTNATLVVPAFTQRRISDADQVILPVVDVPPGGIVRLRISTAAAGDNIASVPVVLAEEYYKTLAPTTPPTPTRFPTQATATQ